MAPPDDLQDEPTPIRRDPGRAETRFRPLTVIGILGVLAGLLVVGGVFVVSGAEDPPVAGAPTTSDEGTPPTSSAAGTPAAAESEGLGALGWTLLVRPGCRAGWRLAALEVAQAGRPGTPRPLRWRPTPRTATGTQLPSVLTAEDAGQRALSWPPLRAALVDLMRRWDLLAERAPDDQRRNRTGQVRNLLQELVAAVDAENQALATGRDWRLLRPRVDQAARALSAVLAGVPRELT